MGVNSNKPTGTGEEQTVQQPKPEELKKAQPTPNPNVIRIPSPNAELSKIVLDAAKNTPNMRIIREATEELGRALPDITRQYSQMSKDLLGSVTATTTISPSRNRYPGLDIEEGQSRTIEKLNDQATKAHEEVEKLRRDVAADRKEAQKESAAAAEEVKNLVAGANKDVSDLKTDVKSLRAELEKSQLKLIETLGLFVAIFGFIIVSSSAFKDIQNAKVLGGLLMISAGMIMTFVIVLDLLVHRWHFELSIDKVGWKKTLVRWIVPQGIVLAFVLVLSIWGVHLLSDGNTELHKPASAVTATSTPSPSASLSSSPSPTLSPKQ